MRYAEASLGVSMLFDALPFLIKLDNNHLYLIKDGRVVKISNTKYINDNTSLKDMIADLKGIYEEL